MRKLAETTLQQPVTLLGVQSWGKILAPIKIKSALPPQPKKKPKIPPPPPPQNAEFDGKNGFSCRKNAFFQASIKLAQPFPAPELRTKNFTDTRIFWVQSWSSFVTRKSGHIWRIWAEMTQTLMPKSTKVAQIHLPECNSRQNSRQNSCQNSAKLAKFRFTKGLQLWTPNTFAQSEGLWDAYLFSKTPTGPPTHRLPNPPQQLEEQNSQNPKFFESPLQ